MITAAVVFRLMNAYNSVGDNLPNEKVSDELKVRVVERLEKMETALLREFHIWAVSFESRFRANEILVGGFKRTSHRGGRAPERHRRQVENVNILHCNPLADAI
jgi:hypothetical protein